MEKSRGRLGPREKTRVHAGQLVPFIGRREEEEGEEEAASTHRAVPSVAHQPPRRVRVSIRPRTEARWKPQ